MGTIEVSKPPLNPSYPSLPKLPAMCNGQGGKERDQKEVDEECVMSPTTTNHQSTTTTASPPSSPRLSLPPAHLPNNQNTQWATVEGQFISWGCGEFGQHGQGHTRTLRGEDGLLERFSQGETERIKFAACGSSHSIVVTKNDQIFTWGNGNSGQLGLGDKECQLIPTRLHLHPVQDTQGLNQETQGPSQGTQGQNRRNPRGSGVRGVACGGRHSYIWLHNGHVYSFGNNFFAQLGYDFREKNYKENQVKPHLLQGLTYKSVQHVACGDRHSLFLFTGGQLAVVGNGSVGQIGHGSREEAMVPKLLEDLPVIRLIACGANHNLAVDDHNMVWAWGYGRACGTRKSGEDWLFPQVVTFPRQNVIMVSGGQHHSMALTANGNVYTWGCGQDGQLGHGEKVRFISTPRRLNYLELRGHVTYISAGDAYSAVVTDTGSLYMWGKNSHVMFPDGPSNHRVCAPILVDMGAYSISKVECGAWHCVAVTGSNTGWKKHDDQSDGEEDDYADDDTESTFSMESEMEIPRGLPREKTMTIAEFYAPSPTPGPEGKSPSPDAMRVSPSIYHPRTPPVPLRPPTPSNSRPQTSNSSQMESNHLNILKAKQTWNPEESTLEAIKDIQIYLPSVRSIEEPPSLDHPKKNWDDTFAGKFSVTFYVKEDCDESNSTNVPEGAEETALPGNRKALTFKMADKSPDPIEYTAPPQSNMFMIRGGQKSARRNIGPQQEDVQSTSSLPARFAGLGDRTNRTGLPGQPKRIELKSAKTFVIDKNWDMYNKHLKKSPTSLGMGKSNHSAPNTSVAVATSSSFGPQVSSTGGSKAGGSESPVKKSSQAPVIALQRAKSVLAGQSGRGTDGAILDSKKSQSAGSSEQRRFQNPSMVSITSFPAPSALGDSATNSTNSALPVRSISIPGKQVKLKQALGQIKLAPKEINLDQKDGSTKDVNSRENHWNVNYPPYRRQATFSSATSWKNSADQDRRKYGQIGQNGQNGQNKMVGLKTVGTPSKRFPLSLALRREKTLKKFENQTRDPLLGDQGEGDGNADSMANTYRSYSTIATEGAATGRSTLLN